MTKKLIGLNRRSFLKTGTTLGAAALAAPALVKEAFASSGEVTMLDWSDYWPEDMLAKFTAETGIKVNYIGVGSNEEIINSIFCCNAGIFAQKRSDFCIAAKNTLQPHHPFLSAGLNTFNNHNIGRQRCPPEEFSQRWDPEQSRSTLRPPPPGQKCVSGSFFVCSSGRTPKQDMTT